MQKREDIISAIVNLAVPAFTHQEVMEHRQHEVMEKTKKTVLRAFSRIFGYDVDSSDEAFEHDHSTHVYDFTKRPGVAATACPFLRFDTFAEVSDDFMRNIDATIEETLCLCRELNREIKHKCVPSRMKNEFYEFKRILLRGIFIHRSNLITEEIPQFRERVEHSNLEYFIMLTLKSPVRNSTEEFVFHQPMRNLSYPEARKRELKKQAVPYTTVYLTNDEDETSVVMDRCNNFLGTFMLNVLMLHRRLSYEQKFNSTIKY